MTKYNLLLSALLFIFAATPLCLAAAGDSPPIAPPQIPAELLNLDFSNPTTQRIAVYFTLGPLKAELEKTTLDDVRTALQLGVMSQKGDAGEFERWLCYTTADQNPLERIWIESAELGGGKRIDGVTAQAIPSTTLPTADCPALPAGMAALSVDPGIRIGMPFSEVTQKLGEPHKRHNDWLEYSHDMAVNGGWTETGVIYIHLINDKVAYFSAVKDTSD